MGLNPVILLIKLPVPVPSEVWLSPVVGLAEVLQQTPLAVTDAPPLEVTFPPLEALLEVIEDTTVAVSTLGATRQACVLWAPRFVQPVCNPSPFLAITLKL